jgi:hypothetical protein
MFAEFTKYKKNSLFQFVFVRVENGHPLALMKQITVELSEGKQIVDGTTPARAKEGPAGIGEYLEAVDFIQARYDGIETDPVGLIRDAVVVEEHAKPKIVGGKISILAITADGGKWIDKGECN